MFDLQIKSDELIDALSRATRVSSTYLVECSRRLREADRGDLPPLYIREKKGPTSPLQGTRQAANLLFAALQTTAPRNLPQAIERAEFTELRGDYSAILDVKHPVAKQWLWATNDDGNLRGYEHALSSLTNAHTSFIRALEFVILAAFRAPDEFASTWGPMRIVYDSDRNEGQVVAEFTGRDERSPLIVFRYAENELVSALPGIHRESWFTGAVLAEVGRAFRVATAKAAKVTPRRGYGA